MDRETKTFKTPSGLRVEIYTWTDEYQERALQEPLKPLIENNQGAMGQLEKIKQELEDENDTEKVQEKLEEKAEDLEDSGFFQTEVINQSKDAKVRQMIKRIEDVEGDKDKIHDTYMKQRPEDRQKIIDEINKVLQDTEQEEKVKKN